MDYWLFDEIDATFKPKRGDDLQEGVRGFVGRRFRWRAAWMIEEGPYAGQFAWLPLDNDARVIGWVPTEDLEVKR